MRERHVWIACLFAYALASALFASAKSVGTLAVLVRSLMSWLWLFGPPALLIHEEGYAYLFMGTTGLVVLGLILSRVLWSRLPEASVSVACVTLLFWLGTGLLVYAPMA